MSILALAFLGTVTAANPTTPVPWFRNDDYPDAAFVRKQQGTTAFDVVVSPSGVPVDCSIFRSSGSETLDRRACQVAMRASHFIAATDDHGAPVYGVYRTQVRWALDPDYWAQMEVGPDVELSVNKLPGAATRPVEIKYAYLVDAGGNPSSCTAVTHTDAKDLVTLGCQQLLGTAGRSPVATPNGGPVTAVRTGWVRFTPEQ